jgi:cell envelope opacity-associated protein A
MPGRFELKPTLAKIWQAPDNFRIMDPLPPLHRRGIIIGALMVIVGFLLPSGAMMSIPPRHPQCPTGHSVADAAAA